MESLHLIDFTALLAAAVVLVALSNWLGLGSATGFLLAGIIVGPSGLALVGEVGDLSHFAELGIALLLFFLGIELKPARLWVIRRQIIGLGSLQLFGASAALFLPLYFFLGLGLQLALFLAVALAFSSTAFVIQLLHEGKLLRSEFGRAAFAILLLQDLAVVPLLALIPALAQSGGNFASLPGLAWIFVKALLIVGGAFLGGRLLLQPLMRRVVSLRSPELFTVMALLVVLAMATLTEWGGLSLVMGAFLAGLLLADSPYRHQVMAEIHPFRSLLLGLFFMTMGMELDLSYFLQHPWTILAAVLGLVTLKTLALWPLALRFLPQGRVSLALALALAQSGEFSLVLFALAFKNELIALDLYQQLLLVALLSMFITPLLVWCAGQLVRQANAKGKSDTRSLELRADDDAEDVPAVVIVGFGRVGKSIADILASVGLKYLAIDNDSDLVHAERSLGKNVYFGDSSPELLRAAGAASARVVIVTMNDVEKTANLVHALCVAYPDTKVIARGHNLEQCRELREMGAQFVVSENLAASLELARMALTYNAHSQPAVQKLIADYRDQYLRSIEPELGSSDGETSGKT